MEQDMDGLQQAILKLETTDQSQDKNNFRDLYKNWGKYGSQEERRRKLLDFQKSNRLSRLDGFRGIMDVVCNAEQGKLFKPYKKVIYRPSIYVSGFNMASNTYNNVLMLSEWLIEKPEDFEEDWMLVPCPKSTRCLVLAYQGRTKCYNKYGAFRFECHTALPGGSPKTSVKNNNCILDCFYDKKTSTMYVLDLLAWNAQPMTDGETEFRQFWMKSYLEEIDEIKTISKSNTLIFTMLPMIPCTRDSLNTFFSKYPPSDDPRFPPLDGLLFYHKNAQYFSGETPLVGWLFPYMVPEVLGADLQIAPEYLNGKPTDYVNHTDYIQKFEAEMIRKKHSSKRNSAMDTDTSNNIETDCPQGMDDKTTDANGEMESEDVNQSEKNEDNVERMESEKK